MAILPLGEIVRNLFLSYDPIWEHIIDNILPNVFITTILLSSGTAIGTLLIGSLLAWIQVKYDYFGKAFFQRILLLPISIPPYIYASLILGIFEDGGVVQALCGMFDIKILWAPQGNTFTAILVFTAALYPYVYIMAIQAFRSQHRNLGESAQSLGLKWYERVYRLHWPLARPWLFGGVILVIMETLADFGAVSILNQNTFTTAIYSAWHAMFSLQTAAQLASMMLVFIFLLLWAESAQRKKQKFTSRGNSTPLPPKKVSKSVSTIIIFLQGGFLLLVFLLPVSQLLLWIWQSDSVTDWSSLLPSVWASIKTATLASCTILLLALLFNLTKRWYPGKMMNLLFRTSLLGYALPGTIIAVGAYSFFSKIENFILDYLETMSIEWPTFITGTSFLMIFCLAIRFIGLGINPIDKDLHGIRPQLDETAQSLGLYPFQIVKRVLFPLLTPAMSSALIIVFIECIKELPITLMTRPFGSDTVAVKIFEWTSEGMWENAALPALILVILGTFPAMLLSSNLKSEK